MITRKRKRKRKREGKRKRKERAEEEARRVEVERDEDAALDPEEGPRDDPVPGVLPREEEESETRPGGREDREPQLPSSR